MSSAEQQQGHHLEIIVRQKMPDSPVQEVFVHPVEAISESVEIAIRQLELSIQLLEANENREYSKKGLGAVVDFATIPLQTTNGSRATHPGIIDMLMAQLGHIETSGFSSTAQLIRGNLVAVRKRYLAARQGWEFVALHLGGGEVLAYRPTSEELQELKSIRAGNRPKQHRPDESDKTNE